jgi:uncharacterized membrane protein (TIGR02234 family)
VSDSRRSLATVAIAGLAAGAGAAVAGARVWARPAKPPTDFGLLPSQMLTADVPLAGALGLVLLAAWGVVLVTRGRVRRVVTYLLVLVAVGLVITTVAAYWSLDSRLGHDFDALETGVAYSRVHTEMTGWYWTALLSSLVALAAAVAAVRFGRSWPEMSRRYDAPGTVDAGSRSDTDLWRALDEGRDPTDGDGPTSP